MEEHASHESDAAAAQVMRLDARRLKRAWRCPDLPEFPAPDEGDSFPQAPLTESPDDVKDHADATEAIKQVQTMTGVRCATCPWWHTARPWVMRAARAAGLIADGGAALVESEMTAPMMEAVHVIRASRGAEQAYSARKRDER